MTEQSALIITGMHRSATSFAANYIRACGLDLGGELIGATNSNKLGHFEDREILEFHEDMLRYNQTNMYAGVGVSISYTKSHVERAKAMVSDRNQRLSQWGWKQPRACLFLPLWREVMPGARYLLMYRGYKETVSSLYNREYNKIALRNPPEAAVDLQRSFKEEKDGICSGYLSMWIRHNRDLLDHIALINEKDYLLLQTNDILEHFDPLIEYLNNAWGFRLKPVDPLDVYEAGLANKNLFDYNAPELKAEAHEMEAILDSKNEKTMQRLNR